MDLEEELHYSKLKTKGKSQTHLPKLEFLELKPRRRRQGKCVGAALEFCDAIEMKPRSETNSNVQQTCTFISNDTWFHLANYVAPEDVARYALICRQSANSINSRTFWLQMYRCHCQQTSCSSKKSIVQLPEHLRINNISNCDRNTLRQRVIQALFYCHPPFQIRLRNSYPLNILIGRTYCSSWHKQVECVWTMCYRFKLNFPLLANAISSKHKEQIELGNNGIATGSIVDNWESLVDEENNLYNIQKSPSTTSTISELDGITLLVIYSDRFIPFPSDIIYNHATSPLRLSACRELLSTDMRSSNLELDLISSTGDQTITVKYTQIQKFKVLPWWHPDFRIINKCE